MGNIPSQVISLPSQIITTCNDTLDQHESLLFFSEQVFMSEKEIIKIKKRQRKPPISKKEPHAPYVIKSKQCVSSPSIPFDRVSKKKTLINNFVNADNNGVVMSYISSDSSNSCDDYDLNNGAQTKQMQSQMQHQKKHTPSEISKKLSDVSSKSAISTKSSHELSELSKVSDTKSDISSMEAYEILSKATSEIRSQASNEINNKVSNELVSKALNEIVSKTSNEILKKASSEISKALSETKAMSVSEERDVFRIRSKVFKKPPDEEEEQSENEDDFVQDAQWFLQSASTVVQESDEDCFIVLNSNSEKWRPKKFSPNNYTHLQPPPPPPPRSPQRCSPQSLSNRELTFSLSSSSYSSNISSPTFEESKKYISPVSEANFDFLMKSPKSSVSDKNSLHERVKLALSGSESMSSMKDIKTLSETLSSMSSSHDLKTFKTSSSIPLKTSTSYASSTSSFVEDLKTILQTNHEDAENHMNEFTFRKNQTFSKSSSLSDTKSFDTKPENRQDQSEKQDHSVNQDQSERQDVQQYHSQKLKSFDEIRDSPVLSFAPHPLLKTNKTNNWRVLKQQLQEKNQRAVVAVQEKIQEKVKEDTSDISSSLSSPRYKWLRQQKKQWRLHTRNRLAAKNE